MCPFQYENTQCIQLAETQLDSTISSILSKLFGVRGCAGTHRLPCQVRLRTLHSLEGMLTVSLVLVHLVSPFIICPSQAQMGQDDMCDYVHLCKHQIQKRCFIDDSFIQIH